MLKRKNLKIVENHVTVGSGTGDVVSGTQRNVYLTLKDGSAECYYCCKIFVTKDVHEKHLSKTRRNFKKKKNV